MIQNDMLRCRSTELQSIFSTLTHTHFIVPDLGLITPAAGHHMDVHDEKVCIHFFVAYNNILIC